MRPKGKTVPARPIDGQPVEIETAAGRLRGRIVGKVGIFKGIPYAAAPTGARRFAPPAPPLPWGGVKEAHRFADVAPQLPDPGFFPGDPDAMPDLPMSEDCLCLNVWSPTASGPHPVLVWFHGGSQTIGGTARPVYDGSVFAAAGITCITVGFRFGLLGFLECGGLGLPGLAGSGNNALRDMIAALTWIQANIAAFGGDPGQVTIAGESAGAKNVGALVACPAARGLFHAAIMQSGGGDTVHSLAGAEATAARLVELAKWSPDILLSTPWRMLLVAQRTLLAEARSKFPFRPVIDGALLPEPPLPCVRSGRGADVPLLIGTARDECVPLVPADAVAIPWSPAMLSHATPKEMDEVEARATDVLGHLTALERRRRLLTAEEYGLPAIRFADAHSAAGRPTWMYRNDAALPSGPFAGFAPHVADLNLVWKRTNPYDSLPVDWAVHALHGIVCQFVTTHAVDWPRYDAAFRQTALLGDRLRIARDPGGGMRDLFADVAPLRTVP